MQYAVRIHMSHVYYTCTTFILQVHMASHTCIFHQINSFSSYLRIHWGVQLSPGQNFLYKKVSQFTISHFTFFVQINPYYPTLPGTHAFTTTTAATITRSPWPHFTQKSMAYGSYVSSSSWLSNVSCAASCSRAMT